VRFAGVGAAAADTKVSEWMTEDPDVVTPDSDVVAAFSTLSSPRATGTSRS
jgi:hypothetical protein